MLFDEAPLCEAAARLPYKPLFVTVSGAHLYGFASPDSDFDLRGAHVLPLRELVGLDAPRETVEISETRDGLEWDIVSHDARKFFGFLLKDSGYALEQVMSPLVVVSGPEHEELKSIAQKCHNRRFARHYLGFGENQWRLFEKKSPPRVKPLLYIYRVLLTGIHLMRSGELECNLPVLNEIFKISVVDDLIAMKTATQEKIELPNADLAFYHAEYDRLRALLVESEAASPLPHSVDIRVELSDLLLRLRFSDGDTNAALVSRAIKRIEAFQFRKNGFPVINALPIAFGSAFFVAHSMIVSHIPAIFDGCNPFKTRFKRQTCALL